MTAFSDGERTDPVGGKVVRRVGAGVLYRDDRFAHLYWQNFLAVDPANELSAEALIAEADQLFAGLAIRHLLVADARSADRLRPGFRDAGYKEVVLVTMLLRRPPDRRPPAAELVELSAAQLRPTVQAYAKSGPRDDDAVREMCRLKEDLGRNGVRFLGAIVDGEVAGWCEVRGIETRGQVEDVVVLEPFRGRGLARALVGGAVERLRADGCDRIAVVADDNDTVKDLYRHLGFDDAGRTWSFWWPAPW
ncbi:MAG: GNAT family N-acetyltransferase [Actinomycetota bacterium]|jgi:ribosomal protein S18 acetylase RimI-like enzyme|nr:GNAT family N-acetyltransferase [Actinomycetota bacterium]MDQ3274686.1 GNAT family N-acetyltransferase [Actinomycetota bacterium]